MCPKINAPNIWKCHTQKYVQKVLPINSVRALKGVWPYTYKAFVYLNLSMENTFMVLFYWNCMWICCICCLYVVFPRPNRLAICPPDLWSACKTWLNARKSCEMATSCSHSVSNAVILVSLADISQVLLALHRHFTSLAGTTQSLAGTSN